MLFQRVAGFDAIHGGDKGVDALALDVVGVAHHGGFGDLIMEHQGALHFSGADAMARDVDHIVDPPGDPVVAVFIAPCAIPGEVVAGVGLEVGVDHALRVAVDAANLPRPA